MIILKTKLPIRRLLLWPEWYEINVFLKSKGKAVYKSLNDESWKDRKHLYFFARDAVTKYPRLGSLINMFILLQFYKIEIQDWGVGRFFFFFSCVLSAWLIDGQHLLTVSLHGLFLCALTSLVSFWVSKFPGLIRTLVRLG